MSVDQREREITQQGHGNHTVKYDRLPTALMIIHLVRRDKRVTKKILKKK